MTADDEFESQDHDELSTGSRRQILTQIWDEIAVDPCAASAGAVFEELTRCVTEAIEAGNLSLAESLTAKAFLLITS